VEEFMSTNTQGRGQAQMLTGIMLLVLAAAIVIIVVGDLSFWFFPAILVLLVGITFIILSFGEEGERHPGYAAGPSQSRYRFIWGTLLAVLGILGILFLFGVDLLILVALLIMSVGVLILYNWWKG